MTLKIITHTRGNNPVLKKCLATIDAIKTSDMEQVVLTTPVPEEWARSRFRSVAESDYAVFVDDDDVVLDALPEAYQVMLDTQVGIVCAPEIVCYSKRLEMKTPFQRYYERVRETPTELHHLCIINPRFVDPDLLHILKKHTDLVGIDWMIKASAALNGGAITLNRYGYRWNAAKTINDTRTMRYKGALPILRTLTRRWTPDRKGPIPVFNSQFPSAPPTQ